MLKKLLAVAVVAAFVVAAWVLWSKSGVAPTTADTQSLAEAAAPPTAEPVAPRAEAQRRAVAAPPATATGTGGLEVIVQIENRENPVPGVGLELVPRDGSDESLATEIACTGNDGRALWTELEPGPYLVRCDRGAHTDVDIVSGDHQRVTLFVAAGTDVRGLVVEGTGQPVAGATVWRYPGTAALGRERPWPAAVTDNAGAFALPAAGRIVLLRAQHPDYAPSPLLGATVVDPMPPLRLVLGSGPARLVVTLTLDDRPVVDALLELRRPPAPARKVGKTIEQDSADIFVHSDDEGRSELAGLRAGAATLVVRARGAVPTAVDIELRSGALTELALTLAAAGTLRGFVHTPDGAPVAGSDLYCDFLGTRASATTTTSGTFVLDSLPLGSVKVIATGDTRYCGRAVSVELRSGVPAECDFELEPLSTLCGRVIDVAGRGLQSLQVTATRTDLGRGHWRPLTDERGRLDLRSVRRTTTRDDGGFELTLMPAVEYLLDLAEPGQRLQILGEQFGTFTAPRNDVVLTVPFEDLATAYVTGRLRDARGRAVNDAWLLIGDGTQRVSSVGKNTPGAMRSGADGAFSIGPLPARTYRLHVHSSDTEVPKFETEPFTLVAEQRLDLGDVVLPTPARLELSLRGNDGSFFDEALLQLDPVPDNDGRSQQIWRFDADGRLHRAITPGRYRMTIYGGDFPKRNELVELTAGAALRSDFVLPRGIRFTIRLPLPDGETRGTVTVRGADGSVEFERELALDDKQGNAWEPSLSLGPHTAELRCDSGKRYRTSFVVAVQDAAPGERPVPFVPDWSLAR